MLSCQPSLGSFVRWHFTSQTFSSSWICSPEPKTIRTSSSLVISRRNKSVQSEMSSVFWRLWRAADVLLLMLSAFTYNIIACVIIQSSCSYMTSGRHIEQQAGAKPLFFAHTAADLWVWLPGGAVYEHVIQICWQLMEEKREIRPVSPPEKQKPLQWDRS